ncbi:non-ribosomal peptide synthetase [Methyloversatilis thermotolerans]|uniref:non-ribosomal peptide synthetase n=1 Tax=Methyloversatilis thermotolerans TaxID=1346290 RepID=UPI00036A057B|nr:non-ribosomal peptide synthetase [Methyloversatilis thermotolerans]
MSVLPDSMPLDACALAPAQEGMLFHTRLAPGEGLYVEQRWCTLRGALDRAAFRLAWRALVARHDVLRTGFHWQDLDTPLQVVYDRAEADWLEEDWRTRPARDIESGFEAWLAADRARGFDVQVPPLMRCALFALPDGAHRFVWTYHHILMDGWCNGLLIVELMQLYRAACAGMEANLPPAPSYRRFIDWLQAQDAAASERWWRDELAGVDAATELAIARVPRADEPPSQPLEIQYRLDGALGERMDAFAKQARLTPNTLMQAAWALWLARTAGRDDVVFGAVLANRPPALPDVERLVGLCINTVPARLRVDDGAAPADWLQAVQQAQRARELHGHVSLAALQAMVALPGRQALFDSVLVFENYPLSAAMALAGGDTGLALCEPGGHERTHYPLALMVLPEQDEAGRSTFTLCLRIDAARIDAAAARRLPRQIEHLLRGLCDPATARVGDLHPVDPDDLAAQQASGQGTERSAPLLLDALAERTARTPDAIAVCAERRTLDYRALSAAVDALARSLVQAGVRPGQRVGLSLRRSEWLPLAMLAVLRAGAAYVPLDPDYPRERLDWIAQDAGLALRLTDADDALAGFRPGLPALAVQGGPAATDATLPAMPAGDDIAYVLYTSGSTGRPKGVQITHGALASFIASVGVEPGMDDGTHVLALTTLSFDIAGLELLAPQAHGGRLTIASSAQARDGEALIRLIEDAGITLMQATPATWRLLQAAQWGGRAGLVALCGGEALPVDLARWLVERCGALWNMYGPTETTIWSAALRIDDARVRAAAREGSLPVGGPLANTHLQVRDALGRPLPTGVAGELCIAGAGLARGYLNRPDLDAMAFVTGEAGERHYRSGDRVRRREDGLFDFLGRIDRQIKLRGFRIEPGEIEAVIAEHPAVRDVAVQVAGDTLTAWWVPADGQGDADILRAHARAQLPPHMVPSAWVQLDAMPLTPNGKVDRRALPAPGRFSSAAPSLAVRPLDGLQQQVAAVWAQVLDLPREPRLDDDFFALGGHSLPATRVIAKLQTLLGVELPLRSLFDHPRLEDFCAALVTAGGGAPADIPPLPRGGPLPLSSAQRRLWLLDRLYPDSRAYTIAFALRLRGPLRRDALARGLRALAARHEVLRTGFATTAADDEPQAFDGAALPELECADLSSETPAGREQAVQRMLDALARQRFDLAQPPLCRVRLIRCADDEHVLAIAVHHIVADDASLALLVRELGLLYAAGGDDRRAPPALQYADMAAWMNGRDLSAERAWWRQTLVDPPPPLALPRRTGSEAAAAQGPAARLDLQVDAGVAGQLQALARQCGATLYGAMLAAFAVVLARHAGTRDLLIATPVANRRHPASQDLIGLFVNTVPLRIALRADDTAETLLSRLRDTLLDTWAHEALPLDRLLELLPRDAQGAALQTLFSLQGGELDTLDLAGLHWSAIDMPPLDAKVELSLAVRPQRDGGLLCRFEYRADLFDAGRIAALSTHYRALLRLMSAQPQATLVALPMLGEHERALMAAACRGAARAPLGDVGSAFARQAARTPQAIALVEGGRRIDYATLDRLSLGLAHRLQVSGVGRGDAVGVYSGRSIDAIVAMLAIVRCGACFVPLDLQAPAARLEYIAASVGLATVLARDPQQCPLPGAQAIAAGDPAADAHFQPTPVGPDDLIYVMHTSGSTGQPKGVAATHRGVLRLVLDADYVELGPHTVMLHAAPLAFDASTLEVWGALLNGGRLVIASEDRPSPGELADLVVREGVDTLWLTAGLFALMADHHGDAFAGVRQVLAGGDVLPVAQVQALRRQWPGVRVINGYGPTETTTFACCHTVTGDCDNQAAIPIGRAIAGTEVHLLDADMQPVPHGVAGDLYIGGGGVARGYVGQPAATAEAFVPNPFFDPSGPASDAALTLYRTGDRARLREDGAIEFLGRADRQIKLRGFRIEPAEIERALCAHPDVRDALLDLRRDDGTARLIAWVRADGPLAMPALRGFLAARLPDYMVPSAFVQIGSWPLTANGKIDRAALPLPARVATAPGDEAASDALEADLLEVWRSVLPGELGCGTNFFDAGGDSIVAMQLAGRAVRAGIALTPAQVLEAQTVSALATLLRDAAMPPRLPAPARPEGEAPLTPVQQWFFDSQPAAPSHFNQAVMLSLPADVDRAHLAALFARVIDRHDAFRLRFRRRADGGWLQTYEAHALPPDLAVHDLTDVDDGELAIWIDTLADCLHASLDIADGPLLQAALIDAGRERGLKLFIVAHHLVIDGVSWRVLLGDLQQGWLQVQRGRTLALGPKPQSFQQWAHALHAWSPAQPSRRFWQDLIDAACAADLRSLPLDGAGGMPVWRDARQHVVTLPPEDSGILLQGLPRHWQCALPDALLAAVSEAWCEATGAGALWLELESHGRDASVLPGLHMDQTVGWFTALHPLLLPRPAAGATGDAVRAVAQQRAALPDGGLSWGVLTCIERSLRDAPAADLVVNYLGRLDAGSAMDGFTREAAPGSAQHPDNRRSHLLELNAWMNNGCLSMQWTYSACHHAAPRIAALAGAVCAALARCAHALRAPGAAEHAGLAQAAGVDADALQVALAQISFEGLE